MTKKETEEGALEDASQRDGAEANERGAACFILCFCFDQPNVWWC